MLVSESTNLSRAAKRMGKVLGEKIKFSTAYGRLKRFFQTGDTEGVLKFVCLLAIRTFGRSPDCYLLLDRTNWKYGKTNINLLVIGLLYRDVFIPLIWRDLGRAGNSSSKQRLDLLDRLLLWWPDSGVPMPQLHIAGDREFIGMEWFKGLEQRGVKFVMRIPKSFKVELWYKGKIKDRKLGLKIVQRYLSSSCKNSVEAVLLSEYIVNLMVLNNDSARAESKHIFLMTNVDDPQQAAAFYRKRYKIEICFKHLKKIGLRMESMGVEGEHKADLMMAALTVIYLMCIQKGILHFEQQPQQMKCFHLEQQPYIAPAKSVFMQGIEDLLGEVFFFKEFYQALQQLMNWNAKTQNPILQHFYT